MASRFRSSVDEATEHETFAHRGFKIASSKRDQGYGWRITSETYWMSLSLGGFTDKSISLGMAHEVIELLASHLPALRVATKATSPDAPAPMALTSALRAPAKAKAKRK